MEAEVSAAGRTGVFLASFVVLGLVWAVLLVLSAVLDDADLVAAGLAGGLAGALLTVADRTRRSRIEPLGVVAAFGATACVALATARLGSATGSDGHLLLWVVVLVALPTAVATLLWLPHPLLGANVVVVAGIGVLYAPVDAGGVAEVGGKALLLGLLLATLAAVVDLRTTSRVGSFLHYAGVGALAVGKLFVGIELDVLDGAGALAVLGLAELGFAVLLRRRSWAISGWVTLGVAALVSVVGAIAGAPLGVLALAAVGGPLAWLARTAPRYREGLRADLLATLPRPLAESFPP